MRVEEPEVFDATHVLLVDGIRSGAIDGLRIDHPDGLADPEGYLERLGDATGDAWVVVEKILEGDEQLPHLWRTAGTTGYDALLRIGGLFVDPAGAEPLDDLSTELLGERQDLGDIVTRVEAVGRAGHARHRGEPAHAPRRARAARPRRGRSPRGARGDARRHGPLPRLRAARSTRCERRTPPSCGRRRRVVRRARRVPWTAPSSSASSTSPSAWGTSRDDAARDEFVVRFQQTCGPAMAKAIEDTAYYRYVRLVGLNEVGGDPTQVGLPTADFHGFAENLLGEWPQSMTTLSTHDTKRSEDVRARLFVLAERPEAWATWVRAARELATPVRAEELDALTEYFLWQTVVGAWPISEERLQAYALKAIRESKLHTRWTEPNEAYESAVERFVAGVVTTPEIVAHVEAWVDSTERETRANVLGQKLVQLTMPGVPDVYQGTDLVDLSLVDPDNRRLVDYDDRRDRLARLDRGAAPRRTSTTRSCSSRRLPCARAVSGPSASRGRTRRMSRSGPAPSTSSPSGGARARASEIVTVVTRLAGRLADAGGFGDATLDLPEGRWSDVVSARTFDGGRTRLADLVGDDGLPVALLVRVRDES